MTPNRVDAAGVSLSRRPRLYWLSWELQDEPGTEGTGWSALRTICLQGEVCHRDFLEPGWLIPPGQRLATFTTSRPAGLHSCERARWREDSHRYPPYQYKPEYSVHHARQPCRVASILEREVILGFPAHYTEQYVPKSERSQPWVADVRKTLLGNSWSVPVVVCLLKQLFERLGIASVISIQALLDIAWPQGEAMDCKLFCRGLLFIGRHLNYMQKMG